MQLHKPIRAIIFVFLAAAMCVQAHFLLLLPSRQLLSSPGAIDLSLIFTHPMANGPVMEMSKPIQFGAMNHGKKTNLYTSLESLRVSGKTAFAAQYKIKQPGDYVFFVEPAPYWEPAEQKMIVHYTKVVVSAMSECSGWDAMIGFPVEIEPLTRPYGLWTGNSFCGMVRRNGKPVPFAKIEVEYRNDASRVTIPDEVFKTQVIKSDANGVFNYAMPKAGWWAFAALVDGDEKMKNPSGKLVDVELGGLIWVKTTDMTEKK